MKIALFKIVGNLDEERTERIGYWFSSQYHMPSTAYSYQGQKCLAIATDQILPPEIIDEKDEVKLQLIKNQHSLLFENENDRLTIENLMYRSIEEHFRKTKKSEIWLRYRINKTYCEQGHLSIDKKSGVQLFPCFNLYSECLNDTSIAIVIDTSSTLVESKTLLEAYRSLSRAEFASRYDGKNVLLTDERCQKRTRYFVGVKDGYNVDSLIVHPFRDDTTRTSVRIKFMNYNGLTKVGFDQNEPVAEIKNFNGQDESEYVPLSCIQYTPDLNELKEDYDTIDFSDNIYISPKEKFNRIVNYLDYFDGIVFGKYKNQIKLYFEKHPVEANNVLDPPDLQFRNGSILESKKSKDSNSLKFQKLNALKRHGYYKSPELTELFVLHRSSFDIQLSERFRRDLIAGLQEYNLPFSEENVSIKSHIDSINDLEKFIQGLDEEVTIGIVPIINDRYLEYKKVKEVLNKNDLPSQAVREDSLRSFDPKKGKYKGLIQNVVSGIITKCDGIPWILSDKLSSDLIIGIDSGGEKNKRAWATAYVFDEHGKKIHVRSPNFYSKEGIPKEEFKKLILDAVQYRYKLSGEAKEAQIKGITIHRDGFLTKTERDGLDSAITLLRAEGKLRDDFNCVAVNVKKGSNFRLFSENEGVAENPPIGTYYILDQNRAFLSTTGFPLLKKPTSKPLLLELVNIIGMQDITEAIRDVYYLSELNWGSPTSNIKLPITIYYADKMVDFADFDSKPTYLPV